MTRARARRALAVTVAVTMTMNGLACDAAHASASVARAMKPGEIDLDLDASGGRDDSSAFVVDYRATRAERAIADALGRSVLAERGNARGVGLAGEDGGAELALVRRAGKGTETARAVRRIRGGEDGMGGRGGTFAPNGFGGGRGASLVAASGRRVFATESCADEFKLVEGGAEVEYEAEPLRAYLRAREMSSDGRLRAVVMTCGDDGEASGDSGEAFADDLETVERAGVSAAGVIYDDDDDDDERFETDKTTERGHGGERRRNLLADDAAEEPKCGALCATQVELIMGVIVFWGLLLTLMYGWGLMTDLDTPQYWGKPDEREKVD